MKHLSKILPEAILQYNILTRKELDQYTREANIASVALHEYLLANDLVQEKQLLIALSQYLQIELIDFRGIEIPQDVITRVAVKVAWYYKFMPIRFEKEILTIATAFPLDVKTQDEIRMHLGLEVKGVLALESELHEALKKNYGFASDTIEHIMTKEAPPADNLVLDTSHWIEDLELESENPTVSHLVNQIILEAYRKRATDIHIEPYRNKVRFRYRIDGVLVDANLPANVKHFLLPILSRIKIMANLSITEKRLPQDGAAVVKTRDQHLDLRVSTMPTPRGESMVIRILPTKVMLFSLEKLGFNPDSISKFRNLIKKPHGIIFITGPTGSGKTTTLYACLNEINAPGRKIITIEDPVEYEMEGITQIQVNSKVSFDFATGLRSLLRHDPDIIMVGEVRDLETAEMAIRTALTGHLVFSTLHTNDAASGITRLIDMGVEPYLVASSVEAFVAQRLVRVICTKCKTEEADSVTARFKDEIRQSLSLPADHPITISKGQGCERCNYTGYYGRLAIYEILTLNDSLRAAVLEKPRSDYIKQIAIRQGLTTLRQNGWKAVLDGFTTTDEVLNVTVQDKPIFGMHQQELTGSSEPVAEGGASMASVAPPVERPAHRNWDEEDVIDSRFHARKYHQIPLRYRHVRNDPQHASHLVPDGEEVRTVTFDISAGGLSFFSPVSMNEGTVLQISLDLMNVEKPVDCLAKVCRIEKSPQAKMFTIIVYYLDMSSDDRSRINQCVLAESPPPQKERLKTE